MRVHREEGREGGQVWSSLRGRRALTWCGWDPNQDKFVTGWTRHIFPGKHSYEHFYQNSKHSIKMFPGQCGPPSLTRLNCQQSGRKQGRSEFSCKGGGGVQSGHHPRATTKHGCVESWTVINALVYGWYLFRMDKSSDKENRKGSFCTSFCISGPPLRHRIRDMLVLNRYFPSLKTVRYPLRS